MNRTSKLLLILCILVISFSIYIFYINFDVIMKGIDNFIDTIKDHEVVIPEDTKNHRIYNYKTVSETNDFNPKNMNDLKLQKANEEKLAKERLEAAKELAGRLENMQVVLKIKAGEGGRTFGTISSKEIVQAAKEQFDIEIDKKKVQIPDAIKSLGMYEVNVKLHPSVTGKLKVHVEEM